jgi:carboxyl-terminal processing protease
MDVFGKVYKEVALNYLDEIDVTKFMHAGLDGMLSTLDPYTSFVDASRKDEVDLLTTGKYGGIGISIGQRDSSVIITDIMDGYSAQKEGLRRGDVIMEIDNTPIDVKNINDIRKLVRGPSGTTLNMRVNRNDRELNFVLTREDIQLKNISFSGVLENGIGYIKLERFNKYAENEMVDALTALKAGGATNGLILDLRDNPGGLLDAAIGILNKFVDKGDLLLTTVGRKPDSERKYFSTESPMLGKDVPIIVLVNENTASASEILSGAIQDLDRGVILGTKSFGKGLVQVYAPLSYGNQLRITNQRYFTPSGRWIQAKNYFKENKYGVFKPLPFLNQTEFKTLDGRTVYAEGGITPDTVVKVFENNELLDQLQIQDAYFKFAEKYTSENPDGSSFAMSDDVISRFYSFLNDPRFELKSKAETDAGNLSRLLVNNGYSDRAKQMAAELESELKTERLKDFDEAKPVIKDMLEIELMKKYNKNEKDIKLVVLNDDVQVQTALGLLKNRAVYNTLLSPR